MRIRTVATIIASLVALANTRCYAQDIALDSYTCEQFLADANEPSNGERLLKSMMMISWATGFAAAFQQTKPRADTAAIRLIAATLGSECPKTPQRRVVDVISDQIKRLASSAPKDANTILSSAPVAVLTGEVKAYDNFDIPQGDARTLKNVELSKCEAVCTADRECQAISYDKWNKWCFLKTKITKLTLDPSSTSVVRRSLNDPEQSKSPIRIEMLVSKTFHGHSLRNDSFHTVQECQKACEQDRACLGFSYMASGQDCRLFSLLETVTHDNGVTSGYKTQAPQ
jgi:hypothetical protein